jgi:hypothetical protein
MENLEILIAKMKNSLRERGLPTCGSKKGYDINDPVVRREMLTGNAIFQIQFPADLQKYLEDEVFPDQWNAFRDRYEAVICDFLDDAFGLLTTPYRTSLGNKHEPFSLWVYCEHPEQLSDGEIDESEKPFDPELSTTQDVDALVGVMDRIEIGKGLLGDG